MEGQNKSLLLFSGEAYNVEMGITNELFQTERDETPACQFAVVPNTVTDTAGKTAVDAASPIEKFAFFMRFLAPRSLRAKRREGPNRSRGAESCSPPSGAPSAIRPRSIRATPPSPRCAISR